MLCIHDQVRYRTPMRSHHLQRGLEKLTNAWLTVSVHCDAFRFDRKAYLTAAKWWILRKRVRARGQLAPLLSQSPKAYTLWALRADTEARKPRLDQLPDTLVPPLFALVDASDPRLAPIALEATLRSLTDEGIRPILVGQAKTADLLAAAAAIDFDDQPWVMPLSAGDRVAPGTAAAYRAAIDEAIARDRSVQLIYADDDQLDRLNRRARPHFKPDWNSELFRHHDYLTGACIVRADRADLEALEGNPDWARTLVAQFADRGTPIHLQAMLHHRQRRIVAAVPVAPLPSAPDLPTVTIIVPTRNRVGLLRTCLEGIAATDYPDLDVIVADNDSDDAETLAYLDSLDPRRHQVMRHAGAFNYSAINNRAAAMATGRLLCLLNNDIEVIDPHWLRVMAAQALRDDVGAVGARLLYPDGHIQHAGVVIGVGNAAGHAHRFVHPDEEGYFRRHALPQFASAVTAACLVVARDRFLAVGGLDEQNFPVAFNDVDLCLRLNQRGWQSLYEPRATLIHHESVSRGLDRDPVGAARFAGELAALQRIWKTNEIVDPWHHPQLSRAAERFSVAV